MDSKSSSDATEQEYRSYEGRIIRTIYYRQIDVSGPSVDDGNGTDTSWFSRLINSLHYTTRNWVVKNYLLFAEGDKLEGEELSESERLLRESDFFFDAKIKAIPVSKDTVDISVVTKERWTLIFQVSFNAQKNSYAGLRDYNFIGLGHSIDASVTHDADKIIGWGTKINYKAFNVGGTFIDITGELETNKKTSAKTLELTRPFFSTAARWAGGIGINFTSDKLLYFKEDMMDLIPFSARNMDVWGGYSIPAWFGPAVFKSKTNIILAGRINGSKYPSRPFTSPDSNRIFANNTVYLLGTGIINRRFYRDHYINRFGTTEDIPVGGLLNFTWGYDHNEFNHRYYYGIEGIFSKRINNTGYFSFYGGLGAFRKIDIWEQKIYSMDLLFHSLLYKAGRWNFRFFAQNKYMLGSARFKEEQIYLDTENGLRGYERFSIHGVSTGLLKLEARIFSPFQPLGFSIGANLFTDFGTAVDPGVNFFNGKIYQSYGAGLRISNESISRAAFDVALVYRPFLPGKSGGSFAVLFTSNITLGFRQFNFSKPSVISYGVQ